MFLCCVQIYTNWTSHQYWAIAANHVLSSHPRKFTHWLSCYGFSCESACLAMASEAVIQLRTHTERLVCHNVVHTSACLLPGCRQHSREASRIPAHVGSGGRCCLHAADWLRVGSDQRLLRLAKEKELAPIRFFTSCLVPYENFFKNEEFFGVIQTLFAKTIC